MTYNYVETEHILASIQFTMEWLVMIRKCRKSEQNMKYKTTLLEFNATVWMAVQNTNKETKTNTQKTNKHKNKQTKQKKSKNKTAP